MFIAGGLTRHLFSHTLIDLGSTPLQQMDLTVDRLTVVCETKWDETKWNETKWDETKWKSVVCEMEICSLRNENL